MVINHLPYTVPHELRTADKISDEEKAAIECIEWMLKNIRYQFGVLKSFSTLTPILPEHRVDMMVVERTLQQLREAIMGKNFQRTRALFTRSLDLTSVPDHTTDDPRTGVHQILSWYKHFEYLRVMNIDENRLPQPQ